MQAGEKRDPSGIPDLGKHFSTLQQLALAQWIEERLSCTVDAKQKREMMRRRGKERRQHRHEKRAAKEQRKSSSAAPPSPPPQHQLGVCKKCCGESRSTGRSKNHHTRQNKKEPSSFSFILVMKTRIHPARAIPRRPPPTDTHNFFIQCAT